MKLVVVVNLIMKLKIEETLTPYKQLVQTAKSLGFVKTGKGRVKIAILNDYVYKNINREPIISKPKRKTKLDYYYNLYFIATCNGFQNNRAGRVKITTLIEFLTSRNIEVPENEVVINQHRKKLSDCKTEYDKLLFQAKELGYKKKGMGLPSKLELKEYLSP